MQTDDDWNNLYHDNNVAGSGLLKTPELRCVAVVTIVKVCL